MYSIDLFQAERHTCASTYTLTLAGFVHTTTPCKSTCGDAIVSSDEVCDDGKNAGTYGGCMPGCQQRAIHCGDGAVNGPEACDDGINLVTYGGLDPKACGPGCKYAPYCGDAIVSNGEECDDGPLNGTAGHCSAVCTLGP
jgi:cysteine-rich repeat protein